jgi:hypothetical protein
LLAAAKHVEHSCDAVDINLGCPQHVAQRGHYGAFLTSTDEDWEIVRKMGIEHTRYDSNNIAINSSSSNNNSIIGKAQCIDCV